MNDYWKELKLDILLAPDKGKSKVEDEAEENKETEVEVVDDKPEIKSECMIQTVYLHHLISNSNSI